MIYVVEPVVTQARWMVLMMCFQLRTFNRATVCLDHEAEQLFGHHLYVFM